MLRSKHIIAGLLSMIRLLHAGDSLTVEIESEIYDVSQQIQESVKWWEESAVSDGRLQATLHLQSIKRNDISGSIHLVWSNSYSETVSIDSVVLVGTDQLSNRIIGRIGSPFVERPASATTLAEVHTRLTNYPFLELSDIPSYGRYGDESIALVIPVRSRFNNSFSGIVGYRPDGDRKGRFTGDLSIRLGNLFGSATTTELNWNSKDERSQDLVFKEVIPFLGPFDSGAQFGFSQSLQDGLFLRRQADVALTSVFSRFGTLSAGISKAATTATDLGVESGIEGYSTRAITLRQELDRRNHSYLSTSGFSLDSRMDIGDLRSEDNKSRLLAMVSAKGELVKPLTGPWSGSLTTSVGRSAIVGGGLVPEGEKFRYGGAATLRGYQEKIFRSDWMVIQQFELRYQLGNTVRLYSFLDGAQHSFPERPLAVGIGLRQTTVLGLLTVEYAVNKESRPSEGKIHIRISGEIK